MDHDETRVSENPAESTRTQNVGSAEKENAGTAEVSRPGVQWWSASTTCLNVAVVHPLLDNRRSETYQFSPSSPRLPSPIPDMVNNQPVRGSGTRQHPFSFDLRDSIQRLQHERKMHELRQRAESTFSVVFRANPVRKYKPMVPKQSTRPLTIPKSPFSRRDCCK